jgi:pyruvate dehydrogenase E1 component
MFGFQRTGDQIWQFGDIRGRGFILGATAGRTTLNGEGLQHEDGHSHLIAATVPSVRAYDPAFAYEIAVIFRDGLRRMLEEDEDVLYYLTLQNENYVMPAMPEGAEEGILRGLYLFRESGRPGERHIQLFGSAVILNEVLAAAEILEQRHGVTADVWSATSYTELRRDALACERWNMLHPEAEARVPHVSRILAGRSGPFVAASDYMKQVPEQIARWVPGPMTVLGTDGFGMSDSREALRRHFEVDAPSIVVASLHALAREGRIAPAEVTRALRDAAYDPDKPDPMEL